ncbi:hypothetical protein [Pseudobacteriovorax antillogorgiicola]|uniref:Uncharacterized protein n=1 Tax=Pseudobacteriovorax antillogorgiicola TaxID=1513793 RepID=A0A1Y6C3B7_9BACT|nr:hypothetical protein [Pseudobacteriovorax antillogorgiicola]TCS43389.1 hypothetical protein EDD56_13729 [Pseudobacteriovorax antillogorgiicola]SMF34925.1 hypothetical protein SAMN06296036_110179 [Pseudobacteriovorax antillogorgiicola]
MMVLLYGARINMRRDIIAIGCVGLSAAFAQEHASAQERIVSRSEILANNDLSKVDSKRFYIDPSDGIEGDCSTLLQSLNPLCVIKNLNVVASTGNAEGTPPD